MRVSSVDESHTRTFENPQRPQSNQATRKTGRELKSSKAVVHSSLGYLKQLLSGPQAQQQNSEVEQSYKQGARKYLKNIRLIMCMY